MLKYRIRILFALAVVAVVPSRGWLQDSIPFVPSPMLVVERMLQLAEVRKDDILYDLGSGDGRIVIEAAKKFGVRGVGVDLNPTLVEQARRRAAEEGGQPFGRVPRGGRPHCGHFSSHCGDTLHV